MGFGSDRNAYSRGRRPSWRRCPRAPRSCSRPQPGRHGGAAAAADDDLQDRYDIRDTVTFGSPLIRPGQREGTVTRLGDAGDPVPLLSLEGTLLPFWNVLGLNRELTEYSTRGILAAHNDSYVDGEAWRGWDALGREGGRATLTVDRDTIQSFAARATGSSWSRAPAWSPRSPSSSAPSPTTRSSSGSGSPKRRPRRSRRSWPRPRRPSRRSRTPARTPASSRATGCARPRPTSRRPSSAGAPDQGAPSV